MTEAVIQVSVTMDKLSGVTIQTYSKHQYCAVSSRRQKFSEPGHPIGSGHIEPMVCVWISVSPKYICELL